MTDVYITAPEDTVVSPSGWVKVGDVWQTVEPLRDRATGLYARNTYAGARTALTRLGFRMPNRTEVDARLDATTPNLVLPVVALPDAKILQDLAAQGVTRSAYPAGDRGDDQWNRASRRDMGGLAWAQHFDALIKTLLDGKGWDGRSLITNLGKLWIGAGPGDTPVGAGAARLKGWWTGTKWTQQGFGDPHNEDHHDYATLTYGVSDTDPSLLSNDARGPLDTGDAAAVSPLLLVGDSLAVGLTRPLGALAKAAGIKFKGDGVESTTIQGWLGKLKPRLLADLAAVRPAFVLMSLGTNDMKGATDPKAAGQRAGELCALLKQQGAEVGWITPPSMPFDSAATETFRNALEAACQAAGAKVLESRMYSFERAKDKIHFTEKGYRDWAGAIADWIDFPSAAPPSPSPTPQAPPRPPLMGAYVSATRITPEMHAWLQTLLHDPATYPLGAKVDRTFPNPTGIRVMQARVATHPPDSKIPRPHRGVELWELQGGPPPAPLPSLGERAVQVAMQEMAAGVHGEPVGSHKSPRIDEYRQGTGAPGDNWCAYGFCYAAKMAIAPGERVPHAYTGRVSEIIRTAGTLLHMKESAYKPQVGDGAIFKRNDEDPTQGGMGHIGRVVLVPDAQGDFQTIEANSTGDAWALRSRRVGDPEFVGWLAYPPAGQVAPGPTPSPPEDLRASVYVQPFQKMQDKKPVGPPVPIGPMPMPVEDYIAHVVQGEIPLKPGAEEAAKAQAIAARTFLRYKVARDPALGTAQKPIPNSEFFQVASPTAPPSAVAAAESTRGVTIVFGGRPILASYIAGAPWPPGAMHGTGNDPRVTYNQGKSGADVQKAFGGNDPDDHGGMSQLGALALAQKEWKWPEILKFFYGEDVDFMRPSAPAPEEPRVGPRDEPIARREELAPSGPRAVGVLAAAAAAAILFLS